MMTIDDKIVVTEMCANCGRENTFVWNVDLEGYTTHCPSCGMKMMLCDACHNSDDCNKGLCVDICIGGEKMCQRHYLDFFNSFMEDYNIGAKMISTYEKGDLSNDM